MSDNIVNMNPIFRGNTREYLLTFVDDAGAAINITGWTVYFTAKKNYADAVASISVEVTVHFDAAGGQTKIPLTPANTDLVPGYYFYDIQVKKAADDFETILSGTVQILAVNRRLT